MTITVNTLSATGVRGHLTTHSPRGVGRVVADLIFPQMSGSIAGGGRASNLPNAPATDLGKRAGVETTSRRSAPPARPFEGTL